MSNQQAPATLCRTAGVCRRPWAMLLAGLAAILLLAFGGIPLLQQLKPVREVREAINRRDIDATALFYTESHISAEAEAAIRDSLQFPPAKRGDPNGPRDLFRSSAAH